MMGVSKKFPIGGWYGEAREASGSTGFSGLAGSSTSTQETRGLSLFQIPGLRTSSSTRFTRIFTSALYSRSPRMGCCGNAGCCGSDGNQQHKWTALIFLSCVLFMGAGAWTWIEIPPTQDNMKCIVDGIEYLDASIINHPDLSAGHTVAVSFNKDTLNHLRDASDNLDLIAIAPSAASLAFTLLVVLCALYARCRKAGCCYPLASESPFPWPQPPTPATLHRTRTLPFTLLHPASSLPWFPAHNHPTRNSPPRPPPPPPPSPPPRPRSHPALPLQPLTFCLPASCRAVRLSRHHRHHG